MILEEGLLHVVLLQGNSDPPLVTELHLEVQDTVARIQGDRHRY